MKFKTLLATTAAACVLSTAAFAGATSPPALPASCTALPSQSTLVAKLQSVVSPTANYGLGFNMWATIVGNDGAVCAVAFSGGAYTDQWLASRVISAQKAATANSLSLAAVSSGTSDTNGKFALASGNLYSADREGGSLFGLQFSNPVSPFNAYQGGVALTAPDPATFGKSNDPMVGLPIGGINVFGGGLALYNSAGQKVGGLGVSGDTSCTDHIVAWKVRRGLDLDHLGLPSDPNRINGPASAFAGDSTHPDNLIFDIPANTQKVGPTHAPIEGNNAISPSGFGHPLCLNSPPISANGTAGGLEAYPVQAITPAH